MPYFLQDLLGLALATLLAPALYLLPGLGLARLLRDARDRTSAGWADLGWALILAIGLFPVADSLLIRWFGFGGMILAHSALLLCALPILPKLDWKGAKIFLPFACLWWLLCVWGFADMDLDGRLYQNFLIYDLVKHAAVTEAIAREGVVFHDPFFARDGTAGYYFYYYGWPAAIRRIAGSAVSARMAFAGCAFWTGIAVPALLWRIANRAGLIRLGRSRQIVLLSVCLCFVTGLDIIVVTARWAATGQVDPHIDIWNTEIVWMLRSALWVPHHLAALIAGWCGMLLAARALSSTDAPARSLVPCLCAGIAFASMIGLSVWVAAALAPLLLGWGIVRLARNDWRLPVAGLFTILLSVPLMIDIHRGRIDDTVPIAFAVRPFMDIRTDEGLWDQLIDLLLLPINYALEFGLFAFGALLALRLTRGHRAGEEGTIRLLLLWSAITSLIVASLFRSTLINNDLGWRAILFAQIAAMVGCIHVGQSHAWLRSHGRLAWTLAILGCFGSIYDIVAQRLARPSLVHTWPISQNREPAIDYDLRAAYGWADRVLPDGATIQHNPASQKRVFDFGLYGGHWPAVADHEAGLFGASQRAVDARMRVLAPVFDGRSTADDMALRARSVGADYLLFTATDPAWRNGPPLPCLYRTTKLCIADMRAKETR